MGIADAWQHKLSTKMALVSLLLPVPSLLVGSLLWSVAPKAYHMLHHGGTVEDNVAWMKGNFGGQLADSMQQKWEGSRHAPRANTFNAAEAEHLEISEESLVALEQVFRRHNQGGAVGLAELPAALREAGVLAEAGLTDASIGSQAGAAGADSMQGLINRWDTNENGALDQTEFLDLIAQKQRDVAHLRVAFDAFDTDEVTRVLLPWLHGAGAWRVLG
jgi:hypothetical protein